MDTHVHTGTFARHGDATIDERMLTLAGEGIELPVSSEHNTRVDFDARRARGGRATVLHAGPGHGGDDAGARPLQRVPDPAAGPRHRSAVDRTGRASRVDRGRGAERPAIVLNHGRDVHGGFRPLGADRHIGVAGEDRDGWALPANAMEVVNSGAVLSDGLALPRDWMGMLNRGLMLTPVGSSDSHDVARYIVGQGRTYVRCDDRRPGDIDLARAMESVRRGRVMVSYGLLDGDRRRRERPGGARPAARRARGPDPRARAPAGRARSTSRCTSTARGSGRKRSPAERTPASSGRRRGGWPRRPTTCTSWRWRRAPA